MLLHIMYVCMCVCILACPFALLAAKHLDLLSKHKRFPQLEQFVPVSCWETPIEIVQKCVDMYKHLNVYIQYV